MQARVIQASSAEVYGKMCRYPVSEEYQGSVDTVGEGSSYAEGKRAAETICTAYRNQYGVDVSAGNGISIKIKDTCQLLLSAMNLASSTMIAQNLGAKKYDRVMVIVNTAIKINLILALCTIVICQIFGGAMVGFFTNNAVAAAAGTLNLRIEIFGQIFYAIFLIYNSLSIGAGQSEFAMFNSFMNCIVVRIVLCYIFDKIWGLTGIYIACMAATFVSCPIGWIYAKSGCWKRDIVH